MKCTHQPISNSPAPFELSFWSWGTGGKSTDINADAINDDVFCWSLELNGFDPVSPLAQVSSA